ncbi:MAG: DNA primase [Pseudomonadota bacterium]
MPAVRLPDGFVDELKSRLRPSAVIGRKVKLIRAGQNRWKGLSPFSNEKTPSFFVDDAKGFYRCFSTDQGGDIISFVQETERLSFIEAVERLAADAGMALPTASPEEQAAYDRRERLKAACFAAADFFRDRLQSAEGDEARAYLSQKRGLGSDAWARHGIGYAPDDWRRLFGHLRAEGFSVDEIVGSGLAKRSEKAKDPYDVFRNRIMFPILLRKDEVIAFGGRALNPDDGAKYMNSPDTELFHKSRVLYNYDRARSALGFGDQGGLIVCEGYMDVIALHEAGFRNAVAPLGTALTAEQLSMIWSAGPDPVLCFDGDRAGLAAAAKAVDLALPGLQPDKSAHFTLLPNKMDPDDLIRSEGRDAMAAQLDAALPLSEMLWRRERDRDAIDTPEREAGLEQRLEQAVSQIRHAGVKAAYGRSLKRRLRDHLWDLRRAARGGDAPPSRGAVLRDWRFGKARGLWLLIRAIDQPALIEVFDEDLAQADFPDPETKAIRDALLDLYSLHKTIDRDALKAHLLAASENNAAKLLDENYLPTSEADPSGDTVQEWHKALELMDVRHGKLETRRDDPGALLASKEGEEKVRRRIAEGRAFRARLSDLNQG